MSSAAITSQIAAFIAANPSVGPYWSASAADSCAIRVICAAKVCGGKVEVSGRPPASEITSGLAVIAIRSRIAEERITRVRSREQSAVALQVLRRLVGAPVRRRILRARGAVLGLGHSFKCAEPTGTCAPWTATGAHRRTEPRPRGRFGACCGCG